MKKYFTLLLSVIWLLMCCSVNITEQEFAGTYACNMTEHIDEDDQTSEMDISLSATTIYKAWTIDKVKKQFVEIPTKALKYVEELRILENSHFKPLLLDTLTNVIWTNKAIEDQKLTGNDLFDEFWFRWWA